MNYNLSISTKTLGLLIFIGFLSSCKEEIAECEESLDVINYLIEPEPLAFIQNYIGTTKVIFENDNNEKIVFGVNILEQAFIFKQLEICPNDASQFIETNATSQLIDISLTNESEFAGPFVVRLAEANLSNPINDQNMTISYDAFGISGVQDALLTYNFTRDNPTINIRDSLLLSGKTFYSVYERKKDLEDPVAYEIKYTMTEGIIYIKDNTTDIEYTYFRKE